MAQLSIMLQIRLTLLPEAQRKFQHNWLDPVDQASEGLPGQNETKKPKDHLINVTTGEYSALKSVRLPYNLTS